mgnify:CR=1 FL=1|tara:strand:- start:297 stop:2042 length:1746 start_codon:yes stop_codon:yes gene_type:complete
MASTYVNDLRLEEMATGDQSGSWGTTTNTNLELIAEAFSFGTEAITTNADTHTTTIADGSTDPGRSIYLKYTGALDSNCTITIGPNTVSKLWFIENATTDSGSSGPYNIVISQGSGASITIPNGHVKAIYSDGAGSGAAMVDAFTDLNLAGTTTVDDLTVSDDLTVTDDVAIGGLATVGGTLGVTGVLTANAGVVVDNITIDGTEIDLSSGDLSIDVAGNIQLDADDNGEIRILDGGTQFAQIKKDGNNALFQSIVADGDFIIQGIDGSSFVTALTLDMSEAGNCAIGSHTPTAKLDVRGSVNSEHVVITGGSNSGRGLSIQTAASGGQQDAGVIFNAQDTESGANPYHAFQTAGTERMRITATGRVGIGTTSPASVTQGIHVVHDATEGSPTFSGAEVGIFQRNFNNSQAAAISIVGGSNSESTVNFADKDDANVGQINYSHADNAMLFRVNDAERARINSSGHFVLQEGNGIFADTGRTGDVQITGSFTNVLNFNSLGGTGAGLGFYLVTAVRTGASVGTHIVLLVGVSTSSAAFIYATLASASLAAEFSNDTLRLRETGGSTINVHVTAVPIGITGND